MKAERRALLERLRRGQGLWLGLLVLSLGLWLGGVRPLWQRALAQRDKARELADRTLQLQQFALHWEGEAVQEEERQLAENARRLEPPRPREAWLEELEKTAGYCQVHCLQLLPQRAGKAGREQKEFLEVTLEGNYFQLLTFFRQWEQHHPGCWTEGGTLEADASGQKLRYHGKFYLPTKKSSKSR